jgi:putative ABC transport system substrate-binding protein
MRRRKFMALVGGAMALPAAAHGQQPKKIPRLCFLTFDSEWTRFDAFLRGLRDLDYVDGQSIAIDYLSADGRSERFPAVVAECLRLTPDVIAVSTTPGAQAAKDATRTIPIIMIGLGDPVRTDCTAAGEGIGGGGTLTWPDVAGARHSDR